MNQQKRMRPVLAIIIIVCGFAVFSGGCQSQRLNLSTRVALFGPVEMDTTHLGLIPRQEPDWLTFDELLQISENPDPGGDLGEKLDRLLRTPLISNEAWFDGQRPMRLVNPRMGQILRVATWNIEKSLEMGRVIQAMEQPANYDQMIREDLAPPGSPLRRLMYRQHSRLRRSDILLLQEMDYGVNRSDYRDAAGDLARAMGMNYAYAVQALEIDPVLLGTEDVIDEKGQVDQEASAYFHADPERYKGAFGSAVLSRYPILRAEVIPLKHKAYDWYWKEKAKTTFLEDTRRFGSEVAFKNVIHREMKVGGRHFFRVDLAVPDVPGGVLSVICIHLEIKCLPAARQAQMLEILEYIQDIPHPVIMAGDFNSAAEDLSPTSLPRFVERSIKDPSTWLSVVTSMAISYGNFVNLGRQSFNFVKNYHDPLAPNLPVVAKNPVLPMFRDIRDFRFADGGCFDFRGDKKRSVGRRKRELANSNEAGKKGYVTTFTVKRPIGPFGLFRLDWIFVKTGFQTDPLDSKDSYRLAPHFGETLVEFNKYLQTPFSDHRPSVVDLPLSEPDL